MAISRRPGNDPRTHPRATSFRGGAALFKVLPHSVAQVLPAQVDPLGSMECLAGDNTKWQNTFGPAVDACPPS